MPKYIDYEIDKAIQKKVKSGLYKDERAVLHSAMTLLDDHDIVRQKKLTWLKDELAKGRDDLKKGRVSKLSMEEIKKKAKSSFSKNTR
ncbi:MAG: hypothetical protein HRT90_06100 [Candidatus Margulisbacteria bacterium]|nr:hypothetical protein [Candidatus Margulisiibacteriota bacterium]